VHDDPDSPALPDEAAEIVQAVVVPEEQPPPWGFWATAGLSLVIFGVLMLTQGMVIDAFAVVEMQRNPDMARDELAANLDSNGLVISLATLLSTPLGLGLTLLFAGIRRGISVRHYLALSPVSIVTMLLSCLVALLFVLADGTLTYLLGRDIVPPVMVEAYQTAGFLPLLWIAMIVAAPLFEEVFFRGFLFRGIQHSWLGAVGAILITSLVWASGHMQYDLCDVSLIFVGGLVLGTIRLKTDSCLPTMATHVLWNLIATVETAIAACQ
jgi:membrane protease YdiL (CAAX protease family)